MAGLNPTCGLLALWKKSSRWRLMVRGSLWWSRGFPSPLHTASLCPTIIFKQGCTESFSTIEHLILCRHSVVLPAEWRKTWVLVPTNWPVGTHTDSSIHHAQATSLLYPMLSSYVVSTLHLGGCEDSVG